MDKKHLESLKGVINFSYGAYLSTKSEAIYWIHKELIEIVNSIEFSDIPMALEELNLPKRAYHCLIAAGILTVEDLLQCTHNYLLKTPNLGKKSLREIQECLKIRGLKLKES
jgi:DNA-directed RNA polymerase alpha subunit